MGFWAIVVWVVVGGLAGWIASKIMKTDAEQGVVGNIVVGILGALAGGFLMEMLGGTGFTGFNLWSFLVALGGAIILTFLWKLVTGRKTA